MSLANYFTLGRIFLSPIFLFIYIQHEKLGISSTLLPYVLLSLLSISEFSDAIDGFLARKYNEVTDFGKIIDPMADSIYRISVFLTFTMEPIHVPILLIFIFIYRDTVISSLRTLCALKGFALAARFSGKMKAFFQALTAFIILLLMIPHSLGTLSSENLHLISTSLVAFTASFAFFSGIEYIIANRQYITKALSCSSS